MADEGDVLTNPNPQGPAGGQADGPVAGIVSQYIKDLSVENPKAPESFQWNEKPELEQHFAINPRRMTDELTEVELKVVVTAKTSKGTAYIIDVAYCALVGMRNISEQQKQAFVYGDVPGLVYPAVRLIVAQATRDAGFRPLLLNDVDFAKEYAERARQQAAAQQGEQPQGGAQPGGQQPGGEG